MRQTSFFHEFVTSAQWLDYNINNNKKTIQTQVQTPLGTPFDLAAVATILDNGGHWPKLISATRPLGQSATRHVAFLDKPNGNWFVILMSRVYFGDWVTEIHYFSLLNEILAHNSEQGRSERNFETNIISLSGRMENNHKGLN